MKVIFHADDFGVSFGVNQGIKDAFENGVLTSTSIRTNGPAYENAVNLIKKELSGIGVGLHINLTDGKPHTNFPTNLDGFYKYTFFQYFLLLLLPSQKLRQEIKTEIEAQFKLTLESGIVLDHVDGQDHIHMIPGIFKITCKLCKKYNVDLIRLSNEPFYIPKGRDTLWYWVKSASLVKNLVLSVLAKKVKRITKAYKIKTAQVYFGVLNTNNMSTEIVKEILRLSVNRGYQTVEVAAHPGVTNYPQDTSYTSNFFRYYTNLPTRTVEREMFKSQIIKDYLAKKGISLVRFGDLF